jgi:hypothetical protein
MFQGCRISTDCGGDDSQIHRRQATTRRVASNVTRRKDSIGMSGTSLQDNRRTQNQVRFDLHSDLSTFGLEKRVLKGDNKGQR